MLRDNRTRLLSIAALIAIVTWISALLPGEGRLRVTFLDVGDGQCVVVCTPSGRILVDDCGTSGRRDTTSLGSKLVAPYLQSQGLDSIDVAVLSHPHSDHLSGMAGLLRLEPASLVLDCGTKRCSPEYNSFRKAFKASHSRYRIARRGQTLDMGDGVKVQILSPSPNADYSDLNNEATVLRVTYKRIAILIDADAGNEAERDMLDAHENVRGQVLLVGHHGSKDATSPEWLAAVQPSIAVISCARRSRYGFPARQTLDRLSSRGVRTYTTGQSGAVTVSSDGESINVRTVKDAL